MSPKSWHPKEQEPNDSRSEKRRATKKELWKEKAGSSIPVQKTGYRNNIESWLRFGNFNKILAGLRGPLKLALLNTLTLGIHPRNTIGSERKVGPTQQQDLVLGAGLRSQGP
jgi:hypothetical protein